MFGGFPSAAHNRSTRVTQYATPPHEFSNPSGHSMRCGSQPKSLRASNCRACCGRLSGSQPKSLRASNCISFVLLTGCFPRRFFTILIQDACALNPPQLAHLIFIFLMRLHVSSPGGGKALTSRCGLGMLKSPNAYGC